MELTKGDIIDRMAEMARILDEQDVPRTNRYVYVPKIIVLACGDKRCQRRFHRIMGRRLTGKKRYEGEKHNKMKEKA